MPFARHRSATFRPASPSLTIARICSLLNLLRFIGPPWNGGPHLTRGGSEGAGHNNYRDIPQQRVEHLDDFGLNALSLFESDEAPLETLAFRALIADGAL